MTVCLPLCPVAFAPTAHSTKFNLMQELGTHSRSQKWARLRMSLLHTPFKGKERAVTFCMPLLLQTHSGLCDKPPLRQALESCQFYRGAYQSFGTVKKLLKATRMGAVRLGSTLRNCDSRAGTRTHAASACHIPSALGPQ